jgi:hypothetical protein
MPRRQLKQSRRLHASLDCISASGLASCPSDHSRPYCCSQSYGSCIFCLSQCQCSFLFPKYACCQLAGTPSYYSPSSYSPSYYSPSYYSPSYYSPSPPPSQPPPPPSQPPPPPPLPPPSPSGGRLPAPASLCMLCGMQACKHSIALPQALRAECSVFTHWHASWHGHNACHCVLLEAVHALMCCRFWILPG